MHILIYHDDADGFAGAYLYNKYGEHRKHTTYLCQQYGAEMPEDELVELCASNDVLITDFHYSRDIMEHLIEVSTSFQCFDHHITSVERFEGMPEVTVDLERSGCQMMRDFLTISYDYTNIWENEIIDYIADRDRWVWQLSWSKEVNAAIGSYMRTFEEYDKLMKTPISALAEEGRAILRYQDTLVENICREAFVVNDPDQGEVVCVNSSVLQSEVGAELCKRFPEVNYSLIYWRRNPSDIKVSLRSSADGLDVSKVATSFPGGGGHPHAAGFEYEASATELYDVLSGVDPLGWLPTDMVQEGLERPCSGCLHEPAQDREECMSCSMPRPSKFVPDYQFNGDTPEEEEVE